MTAARAQRYLAALAARIEARGPVALLRHRRHLGAISYTLREASPIRACGGGCGRADLARHLIQGHGRCCQVPCARCGEVAVRGSRCACSVACNLCHCEVPRAEAIARICRTCLNAPRVHVEASARLARRVTGLRRYRPRTATAPRVSAARNARPGRVTHAASDYRCAEIASRLCVAAGLSVYVYGLSDSHGWEVAVDCAQRRGSAYRWTQHARGALARIGVGRLRPAGAPAGSIAVGIARSVRADNARLGALIARIAGALGGTEGATAEAANDGQNNCRQHGGC